MQMRALAATVVVGVCGAVQAQPVLQMDINGMGIQAQNTAGAAVPFNGTTHTGSVQLFFVPAITSLVEVALRVPPGPFVNQNFNGTLTSLVGTINLLNGLVTGGSLNVGVNGGGPDPDSYSTQIIPNSGQVKTFVGGGFTIEGLTFQGSFDDASFGNVNVAQFVSQLNGSFLQFNFSPAANGSGFADVDVFVVAPAPGTLGLMAAAGLLAARRRRR
jgi:hypothetical protein